MDSLNSQEGQLRNLTRILIALAEMTAGGEIRIPLNSLSRVGEGCYLIKFIDESTHDLVIRRSPEGSEVLAVGPAAGGKSWTTTTQAAAQTPDRTPRTNFLTDAEIAALEQRRQMEAAETLKAQQQTARFGQPRPSSMRSERSFAP